ncbi:TPA: hypothetical protein N2E47_002626 [Salmonella enterica]|nr:hypothetical protein [Salmonella enterica]
MKRDFYSVRSGYSQRKLEIIHEAYLEALYVYGEGDYIEAQLCFCFLLCELQAAVSSADSGCFVSASNHLRILQAYIAECDDRLLKRKGNHHATD